VIRADFDRIALLESSGWNHNDHYHRFLLRHLPQPCAEALDIGCGTGGFARLLAARCGNVLGLDLSPNMIRAAREQSAGVPNLKFEVADVRDRELGEARYDCIASIATFHHLPLPETLARIRRALRPGGVLLVLDLFKAHSVTDYIAGGIGMVVSGAIHLRQMGHLRQPEDVRDAWAEHGAHDHYATLAEVLRACAAILPGAQVRRHMLWRYSLVWRKEETPAS
jgi:ubiquinone/menaquinone biosynthesis C-methylase UbiE